MLEVLVICLVLLALHSMWGQSLILKELKKMSAETDLIASEVAAQTTVIASAVVLLNGISKQITDAVAAAEAGDTAALTKLAADLQGNTDALAAAVAANTPAATPPAGP